MIDESRDPFVIQNLSAKSLSPPPHSVEIGSFMELDTSTLLSSLSQWTCIQIATTQQFLCSCGIPW